MTLEQQPFDILAETYDKDFSHTHIGRLQRERVWEKLLPVLNAYNRPLNILELNCGTGEDALQLASLGHNVIATDASAVMIEKATQKKLLHESLHDRLEFMQCSFEELVSRKFAQRFDLIFSDFGGLNCIDEKALNALSKTLSRLLNPGGHLFFVVMGSFCAWETGYYLLHGKFKTAFRRWRQQAPFTIEGKTMPIYYYNPASFRKLFDAAFIYINSFAVGLFIPPSYLEPFFLKHQAMLGKLNALEKKLTGSSIMCRLSDHYCIVFKKNERE
jgi:ubiquinone/menaquinone biosynthesis C-methylase UbiE